MPCPVLVSAQLPDSFSENVTVKLMLEEGYYLVGAWKIDHLPIARLCSTLSKEQGKSKYQQGPGFRCCRRHD